MKPLFFRGSNAFGKPLIGAVSGAHPDADLGDLTPNGFCKENGCGGSNEYDGHLGGRPNNLPICPLPSTNDRIYTTLAGGGLLVIDAKSTPMSIKGEYGNKIIYGAGCGGTQVGNKMFISSRVSASAAGATQSVSCSCHFHCCGKTNLFL